MMNNIRDYRLQVTVGRPAETGHGQKQLLIFTAAWYYNRVSSVDHMR